MTTLPPLITYYPNTGILNWNDSFLTGILIFINKINPKHDLDSTVYIDRTPLYCYDKGERRPIFTKTKTYDIAVVFGGEMSHLYMPATGWAGAYLSIMVPGVDIRNSNMAKFKSVQDSGWVARSRLRTFYGVDSRIYKRVSCERLSDEIFNTCLVSLNGSSDREHSSLTELSLRVSTMLTCSSVTHDPVCPNRGSHLNHN